MSLIAIMQLNFTVGNIKKNTEKIINSIHEIKKQGADLIIFPELALTGYFPQDNLLFLPFKEQITESLDLIRCATSNCYVILGTPTYERSEIHSLIYNSAVIFHNQEIVYTIHKNVLPNYNVFFESRYFTKAEHPQVINILNKKIGIQICEDMWNPCYPITKSQCENGAELIINISASPFTKEKPEKRMKVISEHVKQNKVPFIYVNLVGGQDELVFDGRSIVMDGDGKLVVSLKNFEESVYLFDMNSVIKGTAEQVNYQVTSVEEEIIKAITLNIRDYITKNVLESKLLIALSGGIDSAITAYLATLIVPSSDVYCIYLPTKYSSDISYTSGKELAENLGINFIEINIDEIINEFQTSLKSDLLPNLSLSTLHQIADENLQARIRAVILMYISNKFNLFVLSTGNKSEIATGFCTLYGDTIGARNLIGDLYKTEVYELAKHINKNHIVIPNSIIDREPTAELNFNQKDSDRLPEYSELDPILKLFIEENKGIYELVSLGYNKELVEKIIQLVKRNEFKRYQLPPTVHLSEKAFDQGRKMPITNGFSY
ncbi:MAG: NAD+ synthase [Candidatus Heimdallarchaeota archaeon]|nr:NAD+ synthase [Candidatus Heimdallarchaeota archaeon]